MADAAHAGVGAKENGFKLFQGNRRSPGIFFFGELDNGSPFRGFIGQRGEPNGVNEVGNGNKGEARMLVLDIDLVIGVCGCSGAG